MQEQAAAIANLLTSLAATPLRLAALTSGLDPTHLQVKPQEDEWAVVEILAHLRVCAEVWGKSIQAMISQDHPTLRYVSPRTVAKKRDYETQPYQDSFQAFAKQREDLWQVLHALPSVAWQRGATFTGTTRGREQTVFSYVQRIVDHEAAHLTQIQAIIQTIDQP